MESKVATINWKFVTHIVPSKYSAENTVIFFSTGKFIVLAEPYQKVSIKFEEYLGRA